MASTNPDFPLSHWYKLVEQGNITLKILRPSILNTKLSAYAQVFGAFDDKKTLLPSPGLKLLYHLLPIDCCLFGPHSIKGFSIDIAMEHYRCFKLFIPSTVGDCIADTVRWFPYGSLKLPIPYKSKLLCSSIDDLRNTLQLSVKNNILPPEGNTYKKILLDLNSIFNNCNLRDTTTKPPKPTDIPRAIVQAEDTTIVPRVQSN